eukprot:5284319-Alexandrium_andersonii.AAC.1
MAMSFEQTPMPPNVPRLELLEMVLRCVSVFSGTAPQPCRYGSGVGEGGDFPSAREEHLNCLLYTSPSPRD